MIPRDFRLLFFGSDTFSIRILKHLLNKKICPAQVVTKPYTQLDKFAEENHLARYRWPIYIDDIKTKRQINIGLVASFGQMIDVDTISGFEHGLFNVHPSLLPQFRGSTPIQTAILKGVEVTGCSIMRIPPVAKFDVGDIVLQEPLKVKPREYAVELSDRLADLGASMTTRLLLNFDESMRHAYPQTKVGSSYAKKIEPQQGEIKFKNECSKTIDRKIRAYLGTVDLYTICLGGLKIKFHDINDPEDVENLHIDRLYQQRFQNLIDISDGIEPGAMYYHKPRRLLCIKCFDGKWTSFGHITPDSKRKMTASEFCNGYLSRRDPEIMMTDI